MKDVKCMGNAVGDQEALNDKCIHLYNSSPEKNDILLDQQEETVIFDGQVWRKFYCCT